MTAANSSEKIHWALVLICEPGLCPRISFPPSGDSQTTLGSAAPPMTLTSGSFNYMLVETTAVLVAGLHQGESPVIFNEMIWFQDKCIPAKLKVETHGGK